MTQKKMMDSSYLVHYGVEGMHWHERQWQNTDGSLTPAGYIHYGYGKGKRSRNSEHMYGSGTKKPQSYNPLYGSTNKKGTKETTENTNKWDHSKSDKSDAILNMVKSSVIAVVQMNPVALANAISTGANAVAASAKTSIYEKERSNNEIDSKTGFAKKSREYTAKEDMARVNPGFKNLDANTKNNCVLCSMTLELRNKGYDVTANKASSGFNSEEALKRYFPDAKVRGSASPKTMAEFNQMKKDNIKKTVRHENAKKVVDEIVGDGDSRGMLFGQWFGAAAGHAVAYEVTNGQLVIKDAQSNKVYNNPYKMLDQMLFVRFTRLDNVDFDPTNIKEVAS